MRMRGKLRKKERKNEPTMRKKKEKKESKSYMKEKENKKKVSHTCID
jgi:hypothetical protein